MVRPDAGGFFCEQRQRLSGQVLPMERFAPGKEPHQTAKLPSALCLGAGPSFQLSHDGSPFTGPQSPRECLTLHDAIHGNPRCSRRPRCIPDSPSILGHADLRNCIRRAPSISAPHGLSHLEGSTSSECTMPHKKLHLPEKPCATCGRSFAWRRKWAAHWDQVRYCSERCRNRGPATTRTTEGQTNARSSKRPAQER